ncbi:MAG: hypothetical protein JNL01_15185 [Bdellovibrionales bacterium]|nr:hypothetical protein [Bdellovibrionales bacterium]
MGHHEAKSDMSGDAKKPPSAAPIPATSAATSAAPNPANANAQPAAAPPALDPISLAQQKNEELSRLVAEAETEYRKLDSRIQNLASPETTKRVRELKPLKERLVVLEKILLTLLMSSLEPRNEEERKIEREALRIATVQYCKANKIEAALWKSIES